MAPPLGELAPVRATERVTLFGIHDSIDRIVEFVTTLPSQPFQGTSPKGGGLERVKDTCLFLLTRNGFAAMMEL